MRRESRKELLAKGHRRTSSSLPSWSKTSPRGRYDHVHLLSYLRQSNKESILQEDATYLRQELIEARARKSASDDELGTIRGKVETLENTITSLSDEGACE